VPVGMTNWRATADLGIGTGGWTEPNSQGLHTYPDCPLKLSIEYQT
jgi:hypothetical protein